MGREKLQSAAPGQAKRLRREARAEKAQRAETRSMETHPKDETSSLHQAEADPVVYGVYGHTGRGCLVIILLTSQLASPGMKPARC